MRCRYKRVTQHHDTHADHTKAPTFRAFGAVARYSRLLGLHCAEDDPSGIEVLGVGLMRGTAEDVHHATDAHIFESGRPYDLDVLLDEERPGNSTGPEVYVRDGVIGQRLLHHDISNLKTSSWLQDSIDFRIDREFVGAEIDHPIRNHDIET